MSVTISSQEPQIQQDSDSYPWQSLAGDTEGDKVENWFERVIWHNYEICSHCFARLRSTSEVEKDDWDNVVEETEYHDAAIQGWDVEQLGEIGLTTVRDDDQQVIGVEILRTHSAKRRVFERTTCGECGSVGGLAQPDTLSEAEAVDRVPQLVARLRELGHAVDADRVYTEIRHLKTGPHRNNDKRAFAAAATVGIKHG